MSIPVHASSEAGPGDRGRAFGQAQRSAVENTVAAYRRLFAELCGLHLDDVHRIGVEVGDVVARTWPDLGEEISGIAAGSGCDERELFAANARTEILAAAGAPECSVLGIQAPTSGSPLLGQNWDFYPELRPSRVVWIVEQPGSRRRWFATLTEAGILAKIGLSSTGLGVCLNILATTADGGAIATPIHILLRLVLQTCDSLEDAVELLRTAPVTASSCVTLGQAANGVARFAALELSPGGANLVEPGRGVIVHTNHFLTAPRRGDDTTPREWPDTIERLGELRLRLAPEGNHTIAGVTEALRSHATFPHGICRHPSPGAASAPQSETLASIVLDLEGRRVLVADGAPCVSPYDEIVLPRS